jgi:hypothetical protein
MSQKTPDRRQPSPNAERLRVAMGWDELPRMTPEERAEFEAEQRWVDEEVRRYYGKATRD